MTDHAPQPDPHADNIILFYSVGMMGAIREDRLFSRGLYRGGIIDVRMYDWPCHWFPIKNLRNQEQHEVASQRLKVMVEKAHQEQPEKRIVLAGHSTGVRVMLRTLEILEQPIVEQAWCLAAAVGRTCDLQKALLNTRRMVNLYSPWDWIMIKIGTMIFGTADGHYGRCAGAKSFTGPGSESNKLEQRKFKAEWRKLGHYGGHTGPLAEAFAREYIAREIIYFEQNPSEAHSDKNL